MSFKHNVGKTDKWVRIILGIIITGAGYYTMSWLWGIVGLIILATGIIDWCLIYKIFGISTCKTEMTDNKETQTENTEN